MVAGVIGFIVVVGIALALSRAGVPVPASGVHPSPVAAEPPAAVVVPTRHQATVLLAAAGVALGSWLAFFLATASVPTDLGDGNNVAAARSAAWHQFWVTNVYALVVLVPALAVITWCMRRRRRATSGLPRRHWWQRLGQMHPVYAEAYRALGRSTAFLLLGSGAVTAWIAWLVVRHFGA